MARPQIHEPSHRPETISHEELRARLRDRALVVVNVMPKETFADGHIPGSINVPVAEIESKANRLIPNLSQETAIYCGGPT
jgi:ArsR family transcriptional regulator